MCTQNTPPLSLAPNTCTNTLPNGVMDGARLVFETAGVTGTQLALALDKVYKNYTGKSALQLGEISMPDAERELLDTDEIGRYFKISRERVNEILLDAEFQHMADGEWTPLRQGYPYAALVNIDGEHIVLKWRRSILPVIAKALNEQESR